MKSGTKEYNKVHYFLRSRYGNADRCESNNCKGGGKAFDYALIKGKSYCCRRSNFMMLCRSCHIKYDVNPKTIEKRRIGMLGNTRGFKKGSTPWNKGKHPEYVQGKNHPMFGRSPSPETMEKLRQSHLGKVAWNKGIPMTLEAKLKLSEAQKKRMADPNRPTRWRKVKP